MIGLVLARVHVPKHFRRADTDNAEESVADTVGVLFHALKVDPGLPRRLVHSLERTLELALGDEAVATGEADDVRLGDMGELRQVEHRCSGGGVRGAQHRGVRGRVRLVPARRRNDDAFERLLRVLHVVVAALARGEVREEIDLVGLDAVVLRELLGLAQHR